MSFNFWSDEERVFVPRRYGLGYSINFKHLARKLGWVKPIETVLTESPEDPQRTQSAEERLRRAVDQSRYEEPC